MIYSLNVVAPVFIIIGLGYIFNYYFKIEIKGISLLYLYILVPALLFNSLLKTRITGEDLFWIIAVMVILSTIILLFSWTLSRVLNWSQNIYKAVSLSTVFMNVGNIGIPLVYFTFGDKGVQIGLIILLFQALLHYTLGIFIVLGDFNPWQGLKELLSLPLPYVVVFALFLKFFEISLPGFISEGMNFLSDSALPLSTLILGMQLARARITRQLISISIATVIRLLVSPLIVLSLLSFSSLSSTMIGILVIIFAAPSSVNSVIISTAYDTEPKLVSSITLVTTTISIITLPLIVSFVS